MDLYSYEVPQWEIEPMRGLLLSCGLVLGLVSVAHGQWNGKPSPHDGKYLVVVRPTDWHSSSSRKEIAVKVPDCAFGAEAPLKEAVEAHVVVRHEGQYALWIHLSGPEKQPARLRYQLVQNGKIIVEGALGGSQAVEAGGPAGYAAYAKEAMKSAPGAKTERKVADDDKSRSNVADDAAEFEQEVLDDLARAAGKEIERDWAHFSRLENPKGERPYYWWKLGGAKLSPGTYQLRLTPAGSTRPRDVLATDVAFLTTSKEVAYPYRGDVDAVPASYIRFRIDELPPMGVAINASIRVHYDPWSVGGGCFSPAGIGPKITPHTQTGYTRWYRLQDIERAPAFGASEGHLLLNIQPVSSQKPARGATQFAVYPHDDYVLREIDWNEPEGTRISFYTDFEKYLHLLRTLRDHGREDYERALAATAGRLQPLTRGELYLGNAWGSANGDDALYMVKALRLLGFNCVADVSDPVLNRKLYGWSGHTGEYWPPAFMPYDEDEAKRQYAEFYEHHFDGQRELYEGVSIFQIADEPGEISQSEMSSPLWKFTGTSEALKYADLAGDGTLGTRKVDFESAVLEAVVEQHGMSIGFRVATDRAAEPTQYAGWLIGRVSVNMEHNLAIVREGIESPTRQTMARPGAVVAATGTEVKIVYERGSAELYLGGKRMQLQTDLPRRGGFAIVGPPKAIRALRLREIRKGEHIENKKLDGQVADNSEAALDDIEDLTDLATGKEAPSWAKEKPLRQALEQDWVVGGGMPEAHAGFRRWAQKQGLKPQLFGQESWDDVRMLTIASAVETPLEARLFYWSRRYSGYLTPLMFALSADAIQNAAPNKKMLGFVALSGHSLNFPSAMPLDMFQLASTSPAMIPGVSDWMSLGGWRWDSHQSVAYSVAMFNAGARRYGQEPISYPMMHCVWPMELRSYTMLANNVRYLSYYNYGPKQQVTEGYWSDSPEAYVAVHRTNNRVAQVDDLLSRSRMRPSRVAMLYSIANEYWNPQSSFVDKRTTFLALSHEYYQPELVTEEQVEAGALEHYDAFYVLDPVVAAATQAKIAEWVRQGGLVWACADAAQRNEFNEPQDLVAQLAGIRRSTPVAKRPEGATEVVESTVDPKAKAVITKEVAPQRPITVAPVATQANFRPHSVVATGIPAKIEPGKALIRAKYDDQRPAWLELAVGKGKLVYVGHRAGLTYTNKALHPGGIHTIWSDTGRALLTAPLHSAKVTRELSLSEPVVMASPMSCDEGTVVLLYNMRPVELKKVQISLREPQRPHSVQYFVDDRLKDLPFDYADGRVTATLPTLDGAQMVAVRRQRAPTDPRLNEMRQRTEEQLTSSDFKAVSCGAWFAGFYPEWKLGDAIVPLLAHEHWEVRRAAAESLGRLRHAAASDALVEVIETEKDSHALGDEIVALALVGDARALALAETLLGHRDAFVRQQAVRAAAARFAANLGSSNGTVAPDVEKFAERTATAGLQDSDQRVRVEAIRLYARCRPQLAIKQLTDPSAFARLEAEQRSQWIAAVAATEPAWQEYLRQGLPGGEEVVLAFARERQHPQLAAALLKQISSAKSISGPLFWGAVHQRDLPLTRVIFDRREQIEAALAGYLPVLLERTTDAQLGHDLPLWQKHLEGKQPASKQSAAVGRK